MKEISFENCFNVNINLTVHGYDATQASLLDETVRLMKTLDGAIYWNDCDFYHYMYDTRLENGVLVENIVLGDGLTTMTCCVCL